MSITRFKSHGILTKMWDCVQDTVLEKFLSGNLLDTKEREPFLRIIALQQKYKWTANISQTYNLKFPSSFIFKAYTSEIKFHNVL